MTGGILGLKYVLQGSGAEVQPKDAGAYYYYGDGETGRERWLAKNAEEDARNKKLIAEAKRIVAPVIAPPDHPGMTCKRR